MDPARKATIEEIRARFDRDVERFSNLEAGQNTAIDSALAHSLLRDCVQAVRPNSDSLLDIGCGAGNLSLHMAEVLPLRAIDLIDISKPMLERAVERIEAAAGFVPSTLQGDIRDLDLPTRRYDVVAASAVFHHLRGDEEWRSVFAKVLAALKPGGVLIVYDLLSSAIPGVHATLYRRWWKALAGLGSAESADRVMKITEWEDSPRPLLWQVRLLEEIGFSSADIVHQNGPFGAYLAQRPL